MNHLDQNNIPEFEEFLKKFTDEQVGLEIAHVSIHKDEIAVTRHLHIIAEMREKRKAWGGNVAPSGKTFEECDRLSKEEWKIMAEELIELLSYDRNGGQDWYLACLHTHGFTLFKGKGED